jgi:DNA repair photolyase
MKPIYEPRTRAKEYGDLCVNIYTGCNHGCVYCFAPSVLRKAREDFERVEPRAGVVDAVKRQIEREGITGKLIHLCFVCDPYPAFIDTTATREVIRAIKSAGNNVQILTKGGKRATRDFDLLGKGDRFGVTYTHSDSDWTEKNEPNAASQSDRLESLFMAKLAGVETWVSCEPVYDIEGVFQLLKSGNYIDEFKVGKLNYHPSAIDWARFGDECMTIARAYGRSLYLKQDLRDEMKRSEA